MVMLDLVLKMQIKVNFLLHVVMMVVILFHVYRFIGLLSASKFQWPKYDNQTPLWTFSIRYNAVFSIIAHDASCRINSLNFTNIFSVSMISVYIYNIFGDGSLIPNTEYGVFALSIGI